MSVWISKGEKQKELELRLYAPESEVIRSTKNIGSTKLESAMGRMDLLCNSNSNIQARL